VQKGEKQNVCKADDTDFSVKKIRQEGYGMNSQKTGQALKEILDKCREGGVLKGRAAFKAALFDLLGGSKFADERLVLKHAMDADSFWMLLKTTQLTPDSAKKAADRIAKESHMAREDAEFVVRCVAAAQGVDPDIVNAGKSGETGSAKKTGAAKSYIQETENTARRDAETQQETAARQNAGTRPRDNPRPETTVPQDKQQGADSLLLSAECKINCSWARIKKSKGKVYFYKGYLRFEPDEGNVYGVKNDATEISYSDIKRFSDAKAFWAFWYIVDFFCMLCCFAGGTVVGVLYFMTLLLIVYFAARKRIGVVRKNSLTSLKKCTFKFSKQADKKTAMSILKTWTS